MIPLAVRWRAERFAEGRADAERLGVSRRELREARLLARMVALEWDRAYWLGVAWQGSRP